jgi:thermitase
MLRKKGLKTMTINRSRRAAPVLTAALLLSLFGCNVTPANPTPLTLYAPTTYAPTTVQHFARVGDVVIESSDTQDGIAAQHGGTVIGWYPDQGYATLGYPAPDGVQLTMKTAIKNYGVPGAQDPKTYGVNSWSTGWSTWAGGWNSWSGGWTSWSQNGQKNIPGQNAKIWDKIGLTRATRLAPKAGQGVIIAVIDTGIDLTHPAFQGVLTDPSTWWDWVSGDAKPQDEAGGASYGHGTSVAGIALQVAPNAKLMPLRVLGADGMGETANVIAAIDWAVAKGARIINLSLGTTRDMALGRALDNATRRGVFVISSSGNSGDQNVTYPASDSMRYGITGDLSVGVGSSDLNDKKSRFSTFGWNKIEVVAVGENVSSPAPGGKMGVWSGTSMAAPMVSGGFALALAERSFSDLRRVGQELSWDSDDLSWSDLDYGFYLGGRLNLENFLKTVLSSGF